MILNLPNGKILLNCKSTSFAFANEKYNIKVSMSN